MPVEPKQAEIWYVDLEPVRGAEMRKTRPCIVVSSDFIGRLPIRLVVPLTAWQEHFASNVWLVKVEALPATGLSKDSAADTLQVRGVDLARFDKARAGVVSTLVMRQIADALSLVTQLPPALQQNRNLEK